MNPDVRRLLIRVLVFAIPLLVYAGFITIVDPYNYFSESSPIGREDKPQISFRLNYAMWKIIDYRRHPVPDILLGDSRMMSLDSDLINEEYGQHFYNLAYGGGSLREAIDTFWLATRTTDPHQVVIGVNLNTFNDNDRKNRVAEVEAALANPLVYLVNRNVLNAAVRIVRRGLRGGELGLGTPDMSKAEFWHHQIEATTRSYYSNYAYPHEYIKELNEVSRYCRDHDIQLSFVTFPSHRDLQDQIARYHLEKAAQSMVDTLATLGTVYDMDWDNDLTRDDNNFKDPYHGNESVMRLVIDSVWGKDRRFVRIHGMLPATTPEATRQ